MPVMSVDKQDSVEPVSSPGAQGVHTSKKMHKNIYISYAAAVSGGGGVHERRRKHWNLEKC